MKSQKAAIITAVLMSGGLFLSSTRRHMPEQHVHLQAPAFHTYTLLCSPGQPIPLVYYIAVVLERNFTFGLFLQSLHINWPTSTAIVLLAKSGQLYRAEIEAENFTAPSAHSEHMKQTVTSWTSLANTDR